MTTTPAEAPLPGMPTPPAVSVRGWLTELLTSAQVNYRKGMDAAGTTQREQAVLFTVALHQLGEACFLGTLHKHMPQVAQSIVEDLDALFSDGSEVGPTIYEKLEAIGIDPKTIEIPEWKPDPEITRMRSQLRAILNSVNRHIDAQTCPELVEEICAILAGKSEAADATR